MKAPPLPPDEAGRIEALNRYQILDTECEPAFDDLTAIAAHICDTPIALVSLMDTDRLWFKSIEGLNVSQIPRELAFCSYTICQPQGMLIIPNTLEDERFATNPLVTSDPNIRFYAGTPLVTSDGFALGTLCALDRVPRQLTEKKIQALQALGRQVMSQMELRLNLTKLERNIIHRQEVEETLRQTNWRLNTTLKKLRHTQSQLIHSEKMSSLGQTVAGIAHEINNPVNFIHANLNYVNNYVQNIFDLLALYQQHYPPSDTIKSQTKALDIDFITEDLPKILSSMAGGTERIREIIVSLRNFSRLDEAEQKIVDIHEGIENTLLILQHRLIATPEHPKIHIIKEYGQIPKLECYAGQINQVFLNIINNAIDALEESFIINKNQDLKIRIHTSADAKTIRIRIADNGTGIPETNQRKIFDPFFTTKPVGKGKGLGLSISHQIIVKQHKGRLRYSTKPNKSTEFHIELPLPLPLPL